MSRRLVVSSLSGVALLVSAGTASAATSISVSSASVHVARGYALSLSGSGSSVSVYLFKTKQASSQSYYISSSAGRMTIGPALNAGNVSASLGTYGKVNMRFTPGRSKKLTGCPKFKGTFKTGTLTGTLRLKIGRTTFSVKTLPASALKGDASVCGGGGSSHPTHVLSLYASGTGIGHPTVTWYSTSRGSSVSAYLSRPAGAVTFGASIHAAAPRSVLVAASDLSSATAKAAGPFFQGKVTFAATPGTSTRTTASGTITGSFSIIFELIGTQKLATPAHGTLMKS